MGIFDKFKETRNKTVKLKTDSEEVFQFISKISHSGLTTFNDFVYHKIKEVYGPFYLQHGKAGTDMINQLIDKRNDPRALEYWLKFLLMLRFEITFDYTNYE